MSRNRSLGLSSLVLLLALLTGCGARQEPVKAGVAPAAAGAEGVAIRVNNNTVPPTTLTVSVAPENGVRQLLGTVTPGDTQTFTYTPTALRTSRFQLIGETTAGAEIVSRPFTLVDAAAVVWDVNLNTINVIEP